MQYKDYYKIFGLPRDATEDDIKRAYRRLARKYHPDVSQEEDAEERFKEIGEAYKVLKDPEARAAYDALGSDWQPGHSFRPPPDWGERFEFRGGAGEADAAQFSDLFEHMFGAQFRQRQSAPAEDHHAVVTIDLEDSYRGASKDIRLSRPRYDENGRLRLAEHTVRVKIPEGIRAGQQIRLRGQAASAQPGAAPGDLYLEVRFSERPGIIVDGADVTMPLPVMPWHAALGGRVTAKTPAGTLTVTLPANCRPGRRLRLTGKGLPGKPPGDLYLSVTIDMPDVADGPLKAAFEQLRAAYGTQSSAASGEAQ